MHQLNKLLLQLKLLFLKINNYLDKYWHIVFILISFFFLKELTQHFIKYINTNEYSYLHNDIFVMSFICFISIYFIKPSTLWFLIPFLIVENINFYPLFEVINNYFFYNSIFSKLFIHVASKDINVIIISFFTLYLICILIFLISYKIIKKKWHLKSIFLSITIFVYLITTLLFHYFLIDKNWHNIINYELNHMEHVSKATKDDLNTICKNQEYICGNSKKEISNILKNKYFDNYMVNISENTSIKGNFYFGDIDNIYLIIKNGNNWVINPELAKKSFHDSGNYFMICLDIANAFWLFFFIWLNMFHFRKVKSEILV